MTDDIVTRLRKHHEWFGTGGQPTSVWNDAADEIEKLRIERDNWKRMYEQLLSTFQTMAEPKKVEPSESFIRNEMYPRNRYHGD